MKNILLIEPSTSGLRLIPTARNMGFRVCVLSADCDERVIPAEFKKDIDHFVCVDTNDLSAISDAALKLHQEYALSAVIPGFEIYVELAAQLSQLIGVPGLDVKTGAALRNKKKMRDALNQHHVRVPKYALLETQDEIFAVAEYVGFPCVIKPVDQSGSVHVSKAKNIEELISAYQAMCRDEWTEMGKGIGSIAVVEEYIGGKEFSAEGFVENGVSHVISVTEKILAPEPFFVEMGHIVPADIDDKTRLLITDYVQQVVNALDMNMGVFHCEIKIDQKGAVLMEIAGRLAGDRICDLILLSSGINLYEIMIRSFLGENIQLKTILRKQYAGIKYFSLGKREQYNEIIGLENIKLIPGFIESGLFYQPGERVPPLTSFMGRVGYAIFVAPSYEEITQKFSYAEKQVGYH